jgi:hypothetical protein
MWGGVYSWSDNLQTCQTLNFYGKNPNGVVAASPTALPCKSGAGAGASAAAAAVAAALAVTVALAAHH